MKFKGIIFDFNGTLILDDEKHLAGWQRLSAELGFSMTDDYYWENMHGSTNELIYEKFYGVPCPKEQIGVFGMEKEIYYREFCEKDPPRFAEGALELISFLNEKGIPHAIATSSEISNVTFFKSIYPLTELFGDNIIYNDGTVRGKPYPDLYLKAAEKLGLDPRDCVTVEDSHSGARACKASGSRMVIGICPRGAEKFKGSEYTDLTITDFRDLDYKNLFEY